MASRKTIKSAIESMMFIWGEPLGVKEMAEIFNEDKEEIYACCRELKEEYERKAEVSLSERSTKAFSS